MRLGSTALLGTFRENVQQVGFFGRKFQATFDTKKKHRLLLIFFVPSMKVATLDYWISVPAGINMPGGTFDKFDKRASWKITLQC